MFELVEVKNYDKYYSFGTDWHTDYYIKCDQDLNIDEVIENLNKLGYKPCGQCTLKTWIDKQDMILETVMY